MLSCYGGRRAPPPSPPFLPPSHCIIKIDFLKKPKQLTQDIPEIDLPKCYGGVMVPAMDEWMAASAVALSSGTGLNLHHYCRGGRGEKIDAITIDNLIKAANADAECCGE